VNFVERVKAMLLSPKSEWPRIAAEPMTVPQIYTQWIMLLAAIAPVAIFIGYGNLRFAIAQYVLVLAITALIALIVDLLAPQFGGTRDYVASLKLAAFSYTPAFLAGIFHVLGPWGGLLILLASVYAWYTFFLGAPVLRKCSPQMAIPFTLLVVVAGMLLGYLAGLAAQGGGLAPR
jgi:hypothetical protein